MAFHRFAIPVYSGGLPGGYDYINNATSGTPALADGPRAVGPNSGSYFVGFGEDGRGLFVNRGLKALAENTDYLDDLLRRDIVTPTLTSTVTAGAPVASIVLPGAGVFLGDVGHPATRYGRMQLFEILDDEDNPVIGVQATGERCIVTALTGGAVGDGFSTGDITLTVAPPIPTGQTYRVYYGRRGNFATMAQKVFATDFRVLRDIPDAPLRFYDANVDDTHADPTGHVWQIARDTGPFELMRVVRHVGGIGSLNGYLRLNAGFAYSSQGTLGFSDVNTLAGPGADDVPFSDAFGNDALYVGAQPLNSIAYPNPSSRSLLRHTNARSYVSVSGSSGPGDFDSVVQAIAYLEAMMAFSGVIHVKGTPLGGGGNVISFGYGTLRELTIRGDGRATTFLSQDPLGDYLMKVGPDSLLTLENLTIESNNLILPIPAIEMRGSIRARNVDFRNLTMLFFDPTAYDSPSSTLKSDIALFEDCYFQQANTTGVNVSCVRFHCTTGSAAARDGFTFRNCAFVNNGNGDAAVKVTMDASTTAHEWRRIKFDTCKFALISPASSGSTAHARGCGAFYVEVVTPGNAGTCKVNEVSFIDCDVDALTGSANTILLDLKPTTATSVIGTAYAIINRVEIRGGRWAVPNARGTDFVPFFLLCTEPVVEDVAFVGGNGLFEGLGTGVGRRGHGYYTDAQKVALRGNQANIASGGTTHAHFWATIGSGGTACDLIYANWVYQSAAFGEAAQPIKVGLKVKNINFRGFNRQGGPSGVICFVSPPSVHGSVDVDGVHISPTDTGVNNNNNNVRFWFYIVSPRSTTSVIDASADQMPAAGSYRGFTWFSGYVVSNVAAVNWHANDGSPHESGIIGLIPEQGISLEDCYIHCVQSCNLGRGISLWTKSWTAVDHHGPVRLRGNTFINWDKAIVLFPTHGSTLSKKIGPYFIEENRIESFAQFPGTFQMTGGIYVSQNSNVRLHHINIHRNVIRFRGYNQTAAWRMIFFDTIYSPAGGFGNEFNIINHSIIDNKMWGDNSDGVMSANTPGIYILPVNAGGNTIPMVVIRGNTGCETQFGSSNSWLMFCKVRTGAGAAVTSPNNPATLPLFDTEVGHSIGVTTQYTYVNNNQMIRNNMLLQTP